MNATNVWYRVLRDLGFEVAVDDLGDLTWSEEGVRFRFMVEHDEGYVRIILPQVWHPSAPESDLMAKASTIVHDVNGRTKVAKLILGSSGVYASAEAFYPTPEIAARFIPELMLMLRVAGELFSQAFFADSAGDAVGGEEDEDEAPEPWKGEADQ